MQDSDIIFLLRILTNQPSLYRGRKKTSMQTLLLVIMISTNCFASSKAQEIKTLEFDKTIAIEDIEQYKNMCKYLMF